MSVNLIHLAQDKCKMSGSYEDVSETPGILKMREFLEQLRRCQFLKMTFLTGLIGDSACASGNCV